MTKSTMYSGGHNVIRSEDLGNTSRSISREIISRKKRASPPKQTNKQTNKNKQKTMVLVVKNPFVNAGDYKRHRFNPWVRKIPWKRVATHSSILGRRIPMDRGAWRTTVHGVTKSHTQLKRLSTTMPGSPVNKNLPANPGDMGSIPGPGRFHVPQVS